MAVLPNPRLREFEVVRRDLEETVARLSETFNHKTRAKLLRQLRLLIQEADSLLQLPESAGTRLGSIGGGHEASPPDVERNTQ